MKIVGLKILEQFGNRHTDVVLQLKAWIYEVEEAQWQTPNDIKARYVHASFLADNRVVHEYRLNTIFEKFK